MPKTLTDYCSSRHDSRIFQALEAELAVLDKEDKIVCAVIALSAFLESRVFLSVQGTLTSPNLNPIKQLVTKLSRNGRLELAQALIDQARP